MWSAWDTDGWIPWWRRRRWSDRTRAQRAVVIGFGLLVWFSLVLAYGLAQRESVPAPAGTPRVQAAGASVTVVASPATTTPPPPATTVAAAVEQAAAAPEAAPAGAEAVRPPTQQRSPGPAPARESPPPRPPRATGCDAVSDDLGTVEPGGKVAFRLDPDCPYRPGSVSIAVNGQPPQPAEVDENGVIWIEVAQ